jgi:hypothetical protein
MAVLTRFTCEVMRGDSPPERRLAGTDCGAHLSGQPLSVLNEVSRRSHGGTSRKRAIRVGRAARRGELWLSDKEKSAAALRRQDQSPSITAEDMQPLEEVGWDDEVIYDTISICARFNFYNRWIHATGVHPMSDEAHRRFGEGTAENGYIHR